MDNNQNKNNNEMPPMPDMREMFASWSVWLGVLGLLGNCMCPAIWELPAGLFLGLAGTALAVLSKKGKPFTEQAQIGFILSILAAACGFIMAVSTIFVMHMMNSDTALGEYVRQMWQSMETQMENMMSTVPAGK